MRRASVLMAIAPCCLLAMMAGVPARPLAASAVGPHAFSGGRAFEDLKHLVGFGPRPSGSPALARAREWMIGQLRQTGATVEEDRFVASTPLGQLSMSNLIVKIPGTRPDIVIVGGHYDTARIPNVAFVGANDGGSSAALLMELARALQGQKYPYTVWLVFFDGEEAVQHWTDSDKLYGSRHFVRELSAKGELARVQAMILLDMVGDAKLGIHREYSSTPWLTKTVFKAAQELGYSRYFLNSPQAIDDDHVPFLNAGVSAVDLIDFEYGPNNSYWHSAQDTVEHCSATSLTIVGRVVLATLDELAKSPRLK